jgi:hypothetical protein
MSACVQSTRTADENRYVFSIGTSELLKIKIPKFPDVIEASYNGFHC